MNILLIYQYFRPEVGAGIERVFYYVKYLSSKGHKFRVLTGIPNYPIGKIYPGYNLRFLKKESFGKNIQVIRTFVYPTNYSSAFRRIVNYLSFTMSSFPVGIFQGNVDVVIASSPPLPAAVVGMFLSKLKRKPLIFEVQDVWPGAAVEVGALKNKLVIKLLTFFETLLYRNSRFVVAPTEETKEILLKDNKVLKKDKVFSVLNSVDLKFFDGQRIDHSLTQKYKLEGKFVVLYSGTLGLQQGVHTLIDCVKRLKNHKKIVFLVVGDGADKDLVKGEAEKNKLENIIILDSVEYKKIPSFVKACDIGLAILKKNKYQDAALAVKVFDYFAGSKPAIVSGGEAMRKLVEEGDAGYWVKAEDTRLLARKILEVSKMSEEDRRRVGNKGRLLVERKYNKAVQVKEWDKMLGILSKELEG